MRVEIKGDATWYCFNAIRYQCYKYRDGYNDVILWLNDAIYANQAFNWCLIIEIYGFSRSIYVI